MASKSSSTPAPLTFDLEQPLVDKIENAREALGFRSTSEVVRLAISKFNYDRYKPVASQHRQISVRLPGDMRSMLKKQAKSKNASIGELLRVAIEGLQESAKKAPAKKAVKKKGR
jgi:Arc/MetJ-type ribon-helix-helix transcriptional regulator